MSSILESLKFVQGAVATKDFVPEMTHYSIKDNRISSYNGRIALSAPIQFDVECNPKAVPLYRAISLCEDSIRLTMLDSGKLSIKSGSFKANIECMEDGINIPSEPEGLEYPINYDNLIGGIRKVSRFIGNDASRPWCNGILLHGQSVFATNNVCLAEAWIGEDLPTLNLPEVAVNELLRIRDKIVSMRLSEKSVSFIYENSKWLRSQLFPVTWPDLYRILNTESDPQPIPSNFFENLAKLKPFLDKTNTVYLADGGISTGVSDTDGAAFAIEGLNTGGELVPILYDHLTLLGKIADSCDWSRYPKPCLFFGDKLRGAIVGIKKQ